MFVSFCAFFGSKVAAPRPLPPPPVESIAVERRKRNRRCTDNKKADEVTTSTSVSSCKDGLLQLPQVRVIVHLQYITSSLITHNFPLKIISSQFCNFILKDKYIFFQLLVYTIGRLTKIYICFLTFKDRPLSARERRRLRQSQEGASQPGSYFYLA